MPSNDNNGRPGVQEKPAVLTSSSSDDGNNSSGDSDETDQDAVMRAEETAGGKQPKEFAAYKDYSHVLPDPQEASLNTQEAATKEPTFPVKLHLILSNPEFEDIICFLPHGRSWRILQQKEFEDRVIPLYFRHGRYSSFARQVNGWGFRRVTQGSDFNSYYHELFLRGMPHLCAKMRRLTAKDIKERKEQDTNPPVPDFYALSRERPLPESSPVTTIPLLLAPPAFASTGSSAVSASGQQNTIAPAASHVSSTAVAEVELAILEKRRAEILSRISNLSGGQAASQPVPPAQNQGPVAFQQQASSSSNGGFDAQQLHGALTTLISVIQSNPACIASILGTLLQRGQAVQPPAPPVPPPAQNPVDLLQQLLGQQQQQPAAAPSQQGIAQLLMQSFSNPASAPVQQVQVNSGSNDLNVNELARFLRTHSASQDQRPESAGSSFGDASSVVNASVSELASPSAQNGENLGPSQTQQLNMSNIAQLLSSIGSNNGSSQAVQSPPAPPPPSTTTAPQTGAPVSSVGPQQLSALLSSGIDLSQLLGSSASSEALAQLLGNQFSGGQSRSTDRQRNG